MLQPKKTKFRKAFKGRIKGDAKGGTEPTITDANVVLGRIGSGSFMGGRLPLDLIDQATELRQLMLTVCEYHFRDDLRLGRQLSDIRAGSGYLDLAEDLQRLVTEKLKAAGLSFTSAKSFVTPRRLALVVPTVDITTTGETQIGRAHV
mgnify:CR=1 FL=1